MGLWLRRVRAALGMGLLWALGGIAVAGVLELLDNLTAAVHPLTRLVDMWPQTLAMLGFPCGVLFAVLLAVLGGRRRFEAFSFAQFTAWGAAAGLLFGVLAMALLGAGPLLPVVTTLLSAVGGASSLALARTAERRGLFGGVSAAPGLADGEAPRLLDRRG